jgi:hypothetical protein
MGTLIIRSELAFYRLWAFVWRVHMMWIFFWPAEYNFNLLTIYYKFNHFYFIIKDKKSAFDGRMIWFDKNY